MRKYKLEIAIGIIFASLITAFMWGTLKSKVEVLPYILVAVCAVALVAVLIPWPQKDDQGNVIKETDSEKYAPKFFAQALLSSIVGIALIVGLAAVLNRARFSKTIDVTERKVNSLSEETTKFLATLPSEVTAYCIGSQDPRERYCEESGQLRGLYSQVNPKFMSGVVNMTDIPTLQKVKPSGYGRLVLISNNGENRTEVVGKVTESKLTNALIGLIKTKKTVYFLVGSGEPATNLEGERNYATFAEILKNRAYDVKEHAITQGDLPADAQLVVAGSSAVPYSPVVENMLRRVLARGGKVFLTVNPYRDPGLDKLLADVGVKLDNKLLVNNRGATQLGGQLRDLAPMRPPIVVGEFSRESPITSVLSPRDIALADGARPISFDLEKTDVNGLKVKVTPLAAAMHAAPVTMSEEQRNRLSLDGALDVAPDAGFDPNKTYPVGVQIEIENPSKLAEGVPAATVAMNNGGVAVDTTHSNTTTPASAAQDGADAKKDGAAAADAKKGDGQEEKKDSAEIVILGFEVAGQYERAAPANTQLLPLAVSHLYRDKELVSIPNKDFAPRQFSLEKSPQNYLFLFAGFLPVATALTGFYIWMRRRSA